MVGVAVAVVVAVVVGVVVVTRRRRKLSNTQVCLIRRMIALGKSYAQAGNKYGVTRQTAFYWVHRDNRRGG